MPDGAEALAAAHLVHEYVARGKRVRALDDVSLQVAAGERVALIGPNGSGKSTLLRSLSGTIHPLQGEVRLFGQPLRHVSPRDRARRLAFVPQDVRIQFPFTVREIVMMGRFPYQGAMGIARPGDDAVVSAAMEMVRIAHLADRPIDQLSGGEAQRAVLAQALAQEPDVLLLDEPTSHLDINFQAEVMDLLLHLNRTRGLTVVASLHELNLAALYCTRVFVLRGGRLFAQGTPREVLTEEAVREVYGVQVHVGVHPASSDAPMLSIVPRAPVAG